MFWPLKVTFTILNHCSSCIDSPRSAEVRKGCVFVYVELYKVMLQFPFILSFSAESFPGSW
jgi:hypothetical protein